jgi:hypothetical protein
VGELRRRGLYDSAMLDALKGNDGAGKNTLPRSAHFAIYYPNLLIPVDDFDQMHACLLLWGLTCGARWFNT